MIQRTRFGCWCGYCCGCLVKTGEIGNKSNGWSNGGEIDEHGGQSGFRMGGPCIEILDYFTERTPGPFVEDHLLCGASGWFPPIPPSRLMTMPLHHHLPEREPSYYRDRGWARCQIAEAQNHIFDSFGERYGLLINCRHDLMPRRAHLFTTWWRRQCWRCRLRRLMGQCYYWGAVLEDK